MMSEIPTTDDGEYYVLPYTHLNITQPIQDWLNNMTEEEREAFFAEQEAQRIKRDEEWAIKQAKREAAYIQKEVDEGMAFPDYVWEVRLRDYDWVETISIHKSRASAQAVIDTAIENDKMMDEQEECCDYFCYCGHADSMSIIRHEVNE
tara:strand:- start:130 stop:576 length:447 start_codon:yes stop_codon:yes gene_type:complete